MPDQGLDGREGLEMLNMGSENLGESEVSTGQNIDKHSFCIELISFSRWRRLSKVERPYFDRPSEEHEE